jgi:hypothetical protein
LQVDINMPINRGGAPDDPPSGDSEKSKERKEKEEYGERNQLWAEWAQ